MAPVLLNNLKISWSGKIVLCLHFSFSGNAGGGGVGKAKEK